MTAGRRCSPSSVGSLLASAPRIAVRGARFEKGKIAGVLELSFEDGSSWAFDVPRVHLKGAQEIAGELATTAAA